MPTNFTQHRYDTFVNNLNNNSIENYFGIINESDKKLNFTSKREENEVYFTVSFIKSYNIDIKSFPKEINDIISSYASEFINISFKILHFDDYPFHPPEWSLSKILCNIKTPFNIKDYYNYIINNHNNTYKKDWSPAINIEKDILEFIQKINHFDMLIEYK
jgi:hypothetical protein